MNEFKRTEHGDEAMLMLDLSDEALENAAGSVWEKAGALTLAFCSGIDSCPSSVRLKAIEQVLASCFSANLSKLNERVMFPHSPEVRQTTCRDRPLALAYCWQAPRSNLG